MAVSLQDVGTFIGGFLGNRGEVYAAGLSAGVYNQSLKLQDRVRAALYKAGQRLGPVLGQAIPAQLAAGAANTAPAQIDRFERKYLGFSLSGAGLAVVLIAAGLILWMLCLLLKR